MVEASDLLCLLDAYTLRTLAERLVWSVDCVSVFE